MRIHYYHTYASYSAAAVAEARPTLPNEYADPLLCIYTTTIPYASYSAAAVVEARPILPDEYADPLLCMYIHYYHTIRMYNIRKPFESEVNTKKINVNDKYKPH